MIDSEKGCTRIFRKDYREYNAKAKTVENSFSRRLWVQQHLKSARAKLKKKQNDPSKNNSQPFSTSLHCGKQNGRIRELFIAFNGRVFKMDIWW